MQDSWFSKKADEIQGHADSHDTKRFYNVLKAVYGPQSSGSSLLLNTDGAQLLTEKEQILEQWAEHFKKVLNHPANINDEAIARLPQVDINEDLNTLPTEDEFRKAVKQLSCGKAPGSNAIPAESMWNVGEILQQLKDASKVCIYKRKGNCQSCDNYRGISFLSIAGKILTHVLPNCLLQHLQQGLLPENQCGFCAESGTADMSSAARQLQEKCQEQHSDLSMTFVDLTNVFKTFDTVSREGLWKIMEKFCCPS
ncbi:uncharacterized protein LOC143296639 [Babylonia areolata]|uniref:uncharacterized protein LOC143296639 n=1 Tax=Babylonia areolata TaxID=304850 RepID=UPI003FD5A8D7